MFERRTVSALIPERLRSIINRARDLSPLAGGPINAAKLMFSIKGAPQKIHRVRYQGAPIHFRAADQQALHEVIAKAEYDFVAVRLKGIAAPIVLDVGAHIGTFALWAKNISPYAQLICVEADPKTFDLLRQNLSLASSVKLLNRAASSSDDTPLMLSTDGPSMSHRIGKQGDTPITSISLPTLIERSGGYVDLLKLDIEGSEEAFLCSNAESLQHVGAVAVELHPALCDTEKVREVLNHHFRHISVVQGRTSSKPLLYCY